MIMEQFERAQREGWLFTESGMAIAALAFRKVYRRTARPVEVIAFANRMNANA